MKTVSKIGRSVAVYSSIVASCSLILTPVSSFALARTASTSTPVAGGNFCSSLATKATTISGQVDSLINKANSAWTQEGQKLQDTEKKVDTEVAADRKQSDSQRQATLTKLSAKATTSAQKQAVVTYGSTVEAAVTTKRNAYDAARQAYRSNLQAAINGRHAAATPQFDAFGSATALALKTAEASCAATPDQSATIRQTLQASLKAARTTMETNLKNDTTIKSQQTQLAATRNAAFKAADQALQASLTAARQVLQQSFGKKAI